MNRCEACKHWGTNESGGRYFFEGFREQPCGVLFRVLTDFGADTDFQPGPPPDFGCPHWEAKQ